MVITVYAALLGFWYIFLVSQVIRVRMGIKGKVQGLESKNLAYAVKAHANFSEYVPLPLILLILPLSGCACNREGRYLRR